MVSKFLILFIGVHHLIFGETKNSTLRESKDFGKFESTKAIQCAKVINRDDFVPHNQKNRTFDPQKAYQDLISNAKPSSEIITFLQSREVRHNEQENRGFHEDEFFIQQSGKIINQANECQIEVLDESIATFRTCRQAADPILIATERTLEIEVDQKINKSIKICKGHRIIAGVEDKGSFDESIKVLEQKYQTDSTIQSYKITPLKLSFRYFIVNVDWSHQDNVEVCDHYRIKEKKQKVQKVIKEQWLYEDQALWELSKHQDCTIVEHVCIDASPKEIQGRLIPKKCWKERLTFLYQFPRTKECNFIKKQKCEQIGQKCIQSSSFGCAMWEMTFKCFGQINKKYLAIDQDKLMGLDDNLWTTGQSSNTSFVEVAAKLAIFDEAKKDLEQSGTIDASKLEIFKGKRMTCSKNVADELMYDCCFTYSGLAKKMGLSKCDADEISLAEMRENGLCHYVGSYASKVLGMWKSRDEHVFCCFNSKLSRLVHEEGRKQLEMGWGKARKPNCEGFSLDILSQLNFSKMDLSEMCDQMPKQFPDDFQDKMVTFQNRLKEQIRDDEVKNVGRLE